MPKSNNFFQNYRTCCTESKTRLKVRSSVENKSLDFNGDRLEEEDWTPLLKALRTDRRLHSLAIRSDYSNNKFRKNFGDRTKPAFYKSTVVNELIESVAICMNNSKVLSAVHLQALPLTRSQIKILADGIGNCSSLTDLTLTGCTINDGMDLLCESLNSHVGLQTIDFTRCGLTSQGAQSVAKIIQAQRILRYDNMWKQSLRFREPGPEHFPGIKNIILNDNPNIGDFGYIDIVHELSDDLWIQQIKVENCGLTSMSATRTVELLKLNETICELDLNRNDKIVPALQERIKNLLKDRKQQQEKQVDDKQNGGKKQLGLYKKSTSELSFVQEKNLVKTNCLNIGKSSINNVELHHTKRELDNTKRHLMKEKEKNEELKIEKQILGDKFMKDWNKRKQIEKERDRLQKKLNRLQSVGNISKTKQTKSSTVMTNSKKGKQKKQNFTANDFSKQTQRNNKSAKKYSKTVTRLQENHENSKGYRIEQEDIIPANINKLFGNSSSSGTNISSQMEIDSEFENDNTNYTNSVNQTMTNDPIDLNPIPKSVKILNGLLDKISRRKLNTEE